MSPLCQLARLRRGQSLAILLRRMLCGTLLAAYVVVAAGVPLPTMSTPTKSGELFPCASSGCGCDSAEKCWRSCCCHTLAERLAWAEKNSVKPPAHALAEARDTGLDSGGRPLAAKGVLVAVATNNCCSAKQTCCKSGATRSCCSPHDQHLVKEDGANFVVAYRALACHGQSLNWLAAVPTLISIEFNHSDELPLVAWLGPHSSDIAPPFSETPTPPPPERA